MEIMISMAVLSIALVALLSANNKALSMNHDAARLTDAVFLARGEMEKIYFNALPEEGVSEKQKHSDYPGFEWRTEIKETPFERMWETRITVYKVNDKKDHPVFSLQAYISK